MIPFEYHYRRRHLDGIVAIGGMVGQVLARRDDQQAWVFDYLIAGPIFASPVSGRRGAASVTLARPAPIAARLWLWPERPLRLLQFFDQAGSPTIYRVDFATYPHRHQHAIYQTDLYLDLFATPDERDYAILDEDELALAYENGMIAEQLRADVLTQAAQLAELLEAHGFGAWLASYCAAPFDLAALAERADWLFSEYAPGQPDGWPEEQ